MKIKFKKSGTTHPLSLAACTVAMHFSHKTSNNLTSNIWNNLYVTYRQPLLRHLDSRHCGTSNQGYSQKFTFLQG